MFFLNCWQTQLYYCVIQLTIPVPCEDHYNRIIVALSTAISPCWILWYFGADANTKSVFFGASALITAFAVIRFGGDEKLPLIAAVSNCTIIHCHTLMLK